MAKLRKLLTNQETGEQIWGVSADGGQNWTREQHPEPDYNSPIKKRKLLTNQETGEQIWGVYDEERNKWRRDPEVPLPGKDEYATAFRAETAAMPWYSQLGLATDMAGTQMLAGGANLGLSLLAKPFDLMPSRPPISDTHYPAQSYVDAIVKPMAGIEREREAVEQAREEVNINPLMSFLGGSAPFFISGMATTPVAKGGMKLSSKVGEFAEKIGDRGIGPVLSTLTARPQITNPIRRNMGSELGASSVVGGIEGLSMTPTTGSLIGGAIASPIGTNIGQTAGMRFARIPQAPGRSPADVESVEFAKELGIPMTRGQLAGHPGHLHQEFIAKNDPIHSGSFKNFYDKQDQVIFDRVQNQINNTINYVKSLNNNVKKTIEEIDGLVAYDKDIPMKTAPIHGNAIYEDYLSTAKEIKEIAQELKNNFAKIQNEHVNLTGDAIQKIGYEPVTKTLDKLSEEPRGPKQMIYEIDSMSEKFVELANRLNSIPENQPLFMSSNKIDNINSAVANVLKDKEEIVNSLSNEQKLINFYRLKSTDPVIGQTQREVTSPLPPPVSTPTQGIPGIGGVIGDAMRLSRWPSQTGLLNMNAARPLLDPVSYSRAVSMGTANNPQTAPTLMGASWIGNLYLKDKLLPALNWLRDRF